MTTARARERVVAARAMANDRWGQNRPDATELRSGRFRLAPMLVRALDAALDRGAVTMRGYDRVLRIAWTLADCDAVSVPTADHIGRALYLRQGVPV